ncbi:MAG: DUF1501 domain-containing protein [Acidobacteria bacterium]|jgi:hypothetical protein|nr:DUF1501 domain-containing protein [Acidobacteriota bacterium]
MSLHSKPTRNRREFLTDAFCGFGSLAFGALLRAEAKNPLAAKKPPLPAKAKSVIFLFMAGGPSQMETFDPKPLLNKLEGQPLPASFRPAKRQFINGTPKLLGTRRTFQQHGKSGLWVSDLLPHTATCADDLAVIRSCTADAFIHSSAQYQLFTGRILPGFPSMGAWSVYGLGSESESLPGYVVMPDPYGTIEAGQPVYSNAFLPAVYQPNIFRGGAKPVLNLEMPEGVTLEQRRNTLNFIREIDEATMTPGDDEFSARLSTYDLAFKMQTEAPAVFDMRNEPAHINTLYGIGNPVTDDFGRRCLMARRLVEKGVRFVTVVSGGPAISQWDAHDDIEENHLRMAARTDQPIAALLKDLKQRGLLDSTLVVWGGEFGRTPEAQGGKGRDHNNTGFTMWMAGGGVKGGVVEGSTDEVGLYAVEKPHHLRDIHTTILHQLGLDQDALNYLHQGRRERLTEIQGEVIRGIV